MLTTIDCLAKDLITHLLCVDPAQRYTIDEFLNHPWCKAALELPPPPTPYLGTQNAPLDSPLLVAVRGGRDGRSPGLASLKEAFDITYAVHRMEEEGARRRAQKGGANRGILSGLNEEDEDEADSEDENTMHVVRRRHGDQAGRQLEESRVRGAGHQTQMRQAQNDPYAGTGSKVAAKRAIQEHRNAPPRSSDMYGGRAGPRDRGRRTGGSPFELDMGNATLLGRRHKRTGQVLGHNGVPFDNKLPENPGSPMRVDVN